MNLAILFSNVLTEFQLLKGLIQELSIRYVTDECCYGWLQVALTYSLSEFSWKPQKTNRTLVGIFSLCSLINLANSNEPLDREILHAETKSTESSLQLKLWRNLFTEFWQKFMSLVSTELWITVLRSGKWGQSTVGFFIYSSTACSYGKTRIFRIS